MKKFLKIGFIAVLLFNSARLYANEGDFSFKVKSTKGKSVSFFIKKAQVVNLFIYDANNEVLYEEKINALGTSTKTYDLNAFPDGDYNFKLVTKSKSAEYKVSINEGETIVSDSLIVEKFDPVFTKENEFITLNMENTPKGPIEVQILNKYSDSLYSEVFEGKLKFTKKFNIAKVNDEYLTFVIKSKDQEFREIVQTY